MPQQEPELAETGLASPISPEKAMGSCGGWRRIVAIGPAGRRNVSTIVVGRVSRPNEDSKIPKGEAWRPRGPANRVAPAPADKVSKGLLVGSCRNFNKNMVLNWE